VHTRIKLPKRIHKIFRPFPHVPLKGSLRATDIHTLTLLETSKVDGIDALAGGGDHWGAHVPEEGPLSCAEEGVRFYVGGAGAGTKSAVFVFAEEFTDDGFAESGDLGVVGVVREGGFVAEDIGERSVTILALERSCPVLHV
jgi:hypothetical protein